MLPLGSTPIELDCHRSDISSKRVRSITDRCSFSETGEDVQDAAPLLLIMLSSNLMGTCF